MHIVNIQYACISRVELFISGLWFWPFTWRTALQAAACHSWNTKALLMLAHPQVVLEFEFAKPRGAPEEGHRVNAHAGAAICLQPLPNEVTDFHIINGYIACSMADLIVDAF